MIAVVDTLDVGYDDVGKVSDGGAPLLFAHAFPLNRTMWAPQVSALVERCRCVAADFRGFGESSVAPPYSVEQYADDLAHLLDQLRIDKVVLVGCSLGGYVAFAFWRRHRPRVRALVLADTRAGADSEDTLLRRRQLIQVARSEGSTSIANLQIPSMVGKTTRDKQPDTFDAVHRMIAQAPVDGIVGALQAMMLRPDSVPLLPTIDVPTLIVVGDEDVPTPVKEARTMHERIPGSRLEIIANAGHLANMERPAAFNHLLTEFLGALSYS
ncbi:MAG TPA: alpha/beta fold hydrolase [Gemmatimonadaceae bacterium]|nr:alpha/beta fold hydrolase [Gemmatimonadaceae bacterium]